jgi:hypothetical protein
MKATKYLAGLALLTLAGAAHADVTVEITGATAFRAAALKTIKARYAAAGVPSFKFAHDQAAGNLDATSPNATRAIFIGNFPGVAGTTTIRCCFTGSVEGIRAVALVTDPTPPTYYQPSLLNSVTATPTGAELANQGTTGAATSESDIAFSDVTKAVTPYAGINLQPSNPAVGVVVFTMLANEGATFTNVTAQQFRALMTTGSQPKSLFTGVTADTDLVFATGRNDGSGTRSSYLVETGIGASTVVQQYVTNVSTSTALTTIQLVPQGGVGVPPQGLPGQNVDNRSQVWGQDVAGNGGYVSGSTLRGDMGKTSTAVTVLDADGNDAFGEPIPLNLVTWLSLNDALSAKANGAVICGYEGVRLEQLAASGTSSSSINDPAFSADKAKVTNGAYTAWNFQNMYRRNAITSGDIKTVYDAIATNIGGSLAAAGIASNQLAVGRSVDGGTVAP